MFRPMRRFRQQLSNEECEQILRDATSGVLALQGDDGYPYGVPINQDSTIKISFTIQKLNLNSVFQGVDSYKDLPLIATTPVVEIKGAK